jgi:rare lipoprotein A
VLILHLKLTVPRELPLEKEEPLLFLFGCRVLSLFMLLFSKLKGFLGGIAIAGMTLAAPSPSLAAGCTEASFYGGHGDGYAWQTTASGEVMNPNAMIVAHRSLPFGTRIRVTNQSNGKSVVVRVVDRGPYIYGRGLDLSVGAFARIASTSRGVANVCYSRV